MTTPIPASPIPQTTPKIGTRYIGLDRTAVLSGADGKRQFETSYAYPDNRRPHLDGWDDIYALLDPSDAAELERLREAKYQAELDMRTTAMSRDVPTAVSPRVWNAWITACDRLSAFEKTIGGGS